MKNLLLVALFIFISFQSYSQDIIRKKIKSPKNEGVKEIYQVLKSNSATKHGYYRRYKHKHLVESGHFANNKKDSTWEIYNQKGQLIASGKFKNDRKAGIWNFYSKYGELVQKYDFDKDTLVYFDVKAEKKANASTPIAYPNSDEEKLPIFIGGTSYMHALIENNLVYPPEAYNKDLTASVKVSFIIDNTGNTTNVKIVKYAGDGFDESAIKLIESLGKNWIPGEQAGKKVAVRYSIPLTFKLEY